MSNANLQPLRTLQSTGLGQTHVIAKENDDWCAHRKITSSYFHALLIPTPGYDHSTLCGQVPAACTMLHHGEAGGHPDRAHLCVECQARRQERRDDHGACLMRPACAVL
eukprot:scaffold235094_cov18-Tisochrysis_lutea.AAC.1